MPNTIRELASHQIAHASSSERSRRFRVFAIDGLHQQAQDFIDANGGSEFIERIVHGAQPDKKKGPYMRPHYKVRASEIPIESVKPGSDEKPKHVDEKHVHVTFESKSDPFNYQGNNILENMLDLQRIWERMKKLAEKRGEPQLRTSVPLFALVEDHQSESPVTSQFLVSIRSDLPTLADRLHTLVQGGKRADAEKLRAKFQEFIQYMQVKNGIKPGTISTGDYFVHHPEGKAEPQFILIMPRGGRLLRLPELDEPSKKR